MSEHNYDTSEYIKLTNGVRLIKVEEYKKLKDENEDLYRKLEEQSSEHIKAIDSATETMKLMKEKIDTLEDVISNLRRDVINYELTLEYAESSFLTSTARDELRAFKFKLSKGHNNG